jgi:hypothetical protein
MLKALNCFPLFYITEIKVILPKLIKPSPNENAGIILNGQAKPLPTLLEF